MQSIKRIRLSVAQPLPESRLFLTYFEQKPWLLSVETPARTRQFVTKMAAVHKIYCSFFFGVNIGGKCRSGHITGLILGSKYRAFCKGV